MSLQQKLLTTFLPVGLLPLMIAGGVSSLFTYRQAIQQAETRLHSVSTLTATLTYRDLQERVLLLKTLVENPLIRDAIRVGAKKVEAENLQSLPIAALETQFAQTKLLQTNPSLNNYLKSVAVTGHFAEIFFTERNGFNIAYSQPTSDFVQRDETWWLNGKQQKTWIGVPEFDQSSQKVTIEIIQAILDPDSQEFLGVLKGGYDVAQLQFLKEELQNLQLQGTEQLQILALGKEITAIVTINVEGISSSQNISGTANRSDNLKQLVEEIKLNGSQTQFGIQTKSWTDDTRRYTLATVPGTSWVVIASVTSSQIQASAYQLSAILSLVFLGLGIISTLVILRFSYTLLAPLKRLTSVAKQVTESADFSIQAEVGSQNDEVGLLANSFNQLLQRVQKLLQEQNQQTLHLEQTLRELQYTQAQMIQAEKMSSLGQLVAGIAHEINNPVSFIYGNLNHVEGYFEDLLGVTQLYQSSSFSPEEIQTELERIDLAFLQEDLPKLLHSMKISSDRIREIVLSLRNFSRVDEAEFQSVDLHQGIDSTLLILQHRLKANPEHPEIQVVKDYGNLPLVECYPGPLNQVFMNLLVNAIDALEETNRNRTYEEIKANPNRVRISTQVFDTEWVQVRIADNGSGMSDATRQRLFEPFFTTKPAGKGTGMGITISHQIMTQKHNGKLECFSKLGEGTEFILWLPLKVKTEVTKD